MYNNTQNFKGDHHNKCTLKITIKPNEAKHSVMNYELNTIVLEQARKKLYLHN